ncbi:MAG: binding-protein-dependent transport system inner rane component [Anaerolineales bacterium]|jgi:multiple sugar transport system permease protein|nr:binding-protein-dependent transport system inner membrane component [Anaerolineales bacterium]MBM2842266.1 binding-protein-dependent transport system inner rane component [Anaerolineales bacterium]
MRSARLSTNSYGYLFIAPFILGFLIFGLYPVYNTLALSLTDTTLMSREVNYIGLKNFERLFADDFFMKAVGNSWLIWTLNFIPQIGIALLLSAWFTNLRLKIRAVGVWRALFFLPNLLMPAAVAALFFSLFSYYGPVNQLMVQTGALSEAMHYLQDVATTRGLVIFIQWWMWFGQTAIILMAGMTAIPIHLYEAAMVDGASSAQMFTRITLPLLKPILIFVFVTSLVGGMQMFDIPFLLTDGRGSPASSIMTNNILMYLKFSSSKGHLAFASSVGVLVFIMTTVCALGIFYILRERDGGSRAKSRPAPVARLERKGSQA